MLLQEKTRQIFVDLGYAPKAAERLKARPSAMNEEVVADPMQTDNIDDEFLIARILFLLTYGTDANFDALINENQLSESVNQVFQIQPLYRR
jgi:Guanine nucleotide exchange factor synembryn